MKALTRRILQGLRYRYLLMAHATIVCHVGGRVVLHPVAPARRVCDSLLIAVRSFEGQHDDIT